MGGAPQNARAPNHYFTVLGELDQRLPAGRRCRTGSRRQMAPKLDGSLLICRAAKYRTSPGPTNIRK